jgi:hypothetical protein
MTAFPQYGGLKPYSCMMKANALPPSYNNQHSVYMSLTSDHADEVKTVLRDKKKDLNLSTQSESK